MAENWRDKLPAVAHVYKLYEEGKFQGFMLAAAVLSQADAKLPPDHVTKLPVPHVITISILAANVAEDHSLATRLLAIAQKHYYGARALDQTPAGVRGLNRLREIIESVGKAIEAKTQNHEEQERQDELVCDICQAALQGKEAFNAHQAQCKLMQAQAKIRRLEQELERQKKEKARHRNRLRITLKEERKGLVTKIQESQARIEEIDEHLEEL